MPPLHRMPVFYLALLLVGATLALASHRRPARVSPEPSASRATASRPAERPTPPAEEAAHAKDDGILRTPDGLRRKVVIKDLDVMCRTEAVGGRAVGGPLDYYSIHFVYGAEPRDVPRMFRIGPKDGPPTGWVPAGSVLEWDTRLMAEPTPRRGRPGLVIYRERPCLVAALKQEPCPDHRGACPIEGEEAGADAEGSSTLGLPILQSETIKLRGDGEATLDRVASLVRDRAPSVPPSEPPPDLRPLLRRIYVAFAIDTTASMQSSIDAAKALANRLVAEAGRRYGDVTLLLGLVEYRDEAPTYGFKTRRVTTFTDPARFRAALDRIRAASSGDGSVDESVLDGVATALPGRRDEPIGAIHLDWPTGRAGELATKLLVLLGDAPDHDRDLERARRLAEWANQRGVTVAAVSIDRKGLSKDERSRYRAQWHALADGSFRPLDRASGFRDRVPPLEVSLADAGELATKLQAIIDDRVEHARNLAMIARAEAEGRLAEYANSQGLTLDRLAPVLVDLHRGEDRPEARPDPRSNGRKAPSVRIGWIAERIGGAEMVRLEVLMSRDELDRLIAELEAVQQASSGDARDLAELLRIGTAAAAGETAFLAADRGGQTFADHLRRRQGLPPARSDSLLRLTQADFLHADDLTRAELDARLRRSIAQLIRRRNQIDWDDPLQTIGGMAPIPYAPLDF